MQTQSSKETLEGKVKIVLADSEKIRRRLMKYANLHPDSKEQLDWIINFLMHGPYAESIIYFFAREILPQYPMLIEVIKEQQKIIEENI